MTEIPTYWKTSLSDTKQKCDGYDDMRGFVRICQNCCKHLLEINETIY